MGNKDYMYALVNIKYDRYLCDSTVWSAIVECTIYEL